MSKKIAVLGCGWLGLPLARHWVGLGHSVHGSTTSEDKMRTLTEAGIRPFQIRLGESGIEGPMAEFLQGMDILLINVPPGLRGGGEENYVLKMEAVHRAVKQAGTPKIIFVSSTSVYGNTKGIVTEQTPPAPVTESGRQMLEAENLFREDPELQSSIIRFGGLIGPDRHPVTRLAGKKGLKNGNAPVNLIHLDDCLALLTVVMEQGLWQETLNGVFPAHPEKSRYYKREALKRNISPPEYDPANTGATSKTVISKAFLTKNYSFFTSIYS